MKWDAGFTLIELLAALAIGSLVTVAAATLLLLGLRFQSSATAEAEEQQRVRTVVTLVEEAAKGGEATALRTTDNGWQLLTGGDWALLTYAAPEGAIYPGQATDGPPLLTGLAEAALTVEGRLLRLTLHTHRGGRYETAIWCRVGTVAAASPETVLTSLTARRQALEEAGTDPADPAFRRLDFLEALAGEYADGGNTGQIQEPILLPDGTAQPYRYYAQWYIGDGWGQNGWNENTPWCGCFLSWAAVKNNSLSVADPLVFANVGTGLAAFQAAGGWREADSGYVPRPGDYVFFDWSGTGQDAAHVGAVLSVENGQICTIEGNREGRMALRA